MGRRADDEDHSKFLRLEGAQNEHSEEPVVSMAAFELHGHGIINSVKDGHPGFVSDDYLNAISAETSVTATELCMAGLWKRTKGGYTVLDQKMVDVSVEQFRRMEADREFCRTTGGHEPMDENRDLCKKCHAWLPTADD